MSQQSDGKPAGPADVLLVFDDSLCLKSLARVLTRQVRESVALYPLTSDFALINAVEDQLVRQGAGMVRRLDSVADIDAEVGRIREAICDWAHEVGTVRVDDRCVKDWFYIERYKVSAWWLGLLSEKNTLKTRAFLHVAQIRALDVVLREGRFGRIGMALAERPVAQALHLLARREALRLFTLGTRSIGSARIRVTGWMQNIGWIGAALLGAMSWLRLCAKWAAVRVAMGRALPDCTGTFLFATYFPAFDQAAAAKGCFLNRYTGPLQALLDRLSLPVTWLLVYVPLHGAGFWYALRQARKFRTAGASLFFPEQLLTPALLVQILAAWLRQIAIARRLYRAMDVLAFVSPPLSAECRPVIERLWHSSFAGPTGLQGLAYLAMFRRLWSETPRPRALAYICEMHAWEKALLGTRRGLADRIPAIGVQHTVVARDYFHYFASPADVNEGGSRLGLPLPEFLATNGPGPSQLLSRCGYHGMREVEALRYTHIAFPSGVHAPPTVPALLVIGSLDAPETRALARLVHAAFRGGGSACVMMKSHPYTPFERILDEAGIDWRGEGYRLVEGPTTDWLQQATAVLVASSAVAVEAAALGKMVIVPRFADTMVMGPLDGTSSTCVSIVRSPDELRQCWQRLLRQVGPRSDSARGSTEVASYWHLDHELPRWTALLKEAVGLG